jgi:hypothetical protein
MARRRRNAGAAASLRKRAKLDPVSHVPYLPPEVHRIIARHVDFEVLPDYRLVSKSCAEIGANELFRTMAFHCSSASIVRVNAVKACEQLNKHVNTLVWDTNMWSIPDVRDYHEWVRYLKRQAHLSRASRAVALEPGQLIDLANNHPEWERYVDRVRDEKMAKDHRNLQKLFEGFKNFRKLCVLNGRLVRTPRGIEKTAEYVRVPEVPATYYRGESLYNGDAGPLQRPGGWACNAIQSFGSIGWRLRKLRMDAVHWSVFASAIGDVPSLQQLSSLHLKIAVQSDSRRHVDQVGNQYRVAREALSQHHLMDFLVKLPKLQSLKLELSRKDHDHGHLFTRAPSTLSDMFSKDHSWPNLQKLSLIDFDTTCEALLSLLERQRSTLRVLKLRNIWFEPDEPSLVLSKVAFALKLPEVVGRMHEILFLERARWTGWTGRTCDDGQEDFMNPVGWNLDDARITHPIAEYLVKGGVCPLNDTNMLVRNIASFHRP